MSLLQSITTGTISKSQEVKTQKISLFRFCHQVSLKKWKIDRLNDHQKNKNGLGELRSEKSFLFPHHKICDVYNGAQLKAHQLPPLVFWGQLFSKLRSTEIFGKFWHLNLAQGPETLVFFPVSFHSQFNFTALFVSLGPTYVVNWANQRMHRW